MSSYLNVSQCRRLARDTYGKRLSRSALDLLSRHVAGRLAAMCGIYNGGKHTVTEDAAAVAIRNGKI